MREREGYGGLGLSLDDVAAVIRDMQERAKIAFEQGYIPYEAIVDQRVPPGEYRRVWPDLDWYERVVN